MKKIVIITILAVILLISVSGTARAVETSRATALDLNEEDFRDLALIVYGEANAEPLEGQRAVVEVIANRVMSEHFPDTVRGVLSQKGQFSTWKARNRYTIMQSQIDAIEETRLTNESVFDSLAPEGIDPEDYVYFCTQELYKKVGHKYMHNVVRIGNHIFGTR